MCGGILNDPAGGNFTSPGYLTSNYSSNLNCEWVIQNSIQVNSSIVVLMEDLHLENHQSCQTDYLEFRLGEFEPLCVCGARTGGGRARGFVGEEVRVEARLISPLCSSPRWSRWGAAGQVLRQHRAPRSPGGFHLRSLGPLPDKQRCGRFRLHGHVSVLWWVPRSFNYTFNR